ncbi:3-hydroxybutyryl-CoA dehydrogenase [Catalinimonas alkaloidigena]|uniref:3-hydroxyacyl-CoA dehydrogenase family protein n=1 Tax=Catalinimonas alkaloidigena TaxID=1075417 RepID=UPI002405074A|nr:3-hydroxyacyl-CoA dehydrogenase NAD-binding domain-containing protein [Catalinimonas alkaloidigena]MDF9798945.1 3-hydroxybutyryl-CoA dehydrogenase [Catalinimonas alkaloidigena]
MKNDGSPKAKILVVGSDKVAYSLVVCLLQAGHPVKLYTEQGKQARQIINTHLDDCFNFQSEYISASADYEVLTSLEDKLDVAIAMVITSENLSEKRAVLEKTEKALSKNAIIAINTESFALQEVHLHATHQERVIGANWTEPVHTTLFLEIITNKLTSKSVVKDFFHLAKTYWRKDPYILNHGNGIRSKMMCAMIREAFFLIEKGYVTPEDIDRACRNDPGYYFPFAGNFRYMDLMGAYIYGVVMKDLNPNLSKERHIPDFFNLLMEKGCYGMESGRGFFEYDENEVNNWNKLFRRFSYEIQEIIEKYPFKYLEELKEENKNK